MVNYTVLRYFKELIEEMNNETEEEYHSDTEDIVIK